MEESKRFTVSDAARRFGKTSARIRQICIASDIGRLVFNSIRVLSARDIERIGKIIEKTGRSSGPRKNIDGRPNSRLTG